MRPVKIEIDGGDFALMQDAAAVLAGVTVQTLINWHKQDNPPPRNADGGYSARDFGRWLVEYRGSKKRGPKSKGHEEDDTYVEAERRLKLAQAIKAERDNDVANGNLLAVDTVELQWQTILTRVRSRLLKLPTGLAPVVVGDTDPYSVQRKIKEAVHDALSEASEDWREGEGEEDQ